MGTHLRVLTESYPMNTNMTGFRWFCGVGGGGGGLVCRGVVVKVTDVLLVLAAVGVAGVFRLCVCVMRGRGGGRLRGGGR